jgi:hypothetical protein
VPQGIFLARPGIYFPLHPTLDDLKSVRGRGVGKGTVLAHWEHIVKAWETHGMSQSVHVANVARFCGAKTSITKSRKGYTRAKGVSSVVHYGEWIEREIEMSFDPMPKRAGLAKDGRSLLLRTMPKDMVSMPYKKALRSPCALELAAAEDEMLEQPDGDYAELTDIDKEALG